MLWNQSEQKEERKERANERMRKEEREGGKEQWEGKGKKERKTKNQRRKRWGECMPKKLCTRIDKNSNKILANQSLKVYE